MHCLGPAPYESGRWVHRSTSPGPPTRTGLRSGASSLCCRPRGVDLGLCHSVPCRCRLTILAISMGLTWLVTDVAKSLLNSDSLSFASALSPGRSRLGRCRPFGNGSGDGRGARATSVTSPLGRAGSLLLRVQALRFLIVLWKMHEGARLALAQLPTSALEPASGLVHRLPELIPSLSQLSGSRRWRRDGNSRWSGLRNSRSKLSWDPLCSGYRPRREGIAPLGCHVRDCQVVVFCSVVPSGADRTNGAASV